MLWANQIANLHSVCCIQVCCIQLILFRLPVVHFKRAPKEHFQTNSNEFQQNEMRFETRNVWNDNNNNCEYSNKPQKQINSNKWKKEIGAVPSKESHLRSSHNAQTYFCFLCIFFFSPLACVIQFRIHFDKCVYDTHHNHIKWRTNKQTSTVAVAVFPFYCPAM